MKSQCDFDTLAQVCDSQLTNRDSVRFLAFLNFMGGSFKWTFMTRAMVLDFYD